MYFLFWLYLLVQLQKVSFVRVYIVTYYFIKDKSATSTNWYMELGQTKLHFITLLRGKQG